MDCVGTKAILVFAVIPNLIHCYRYGFWNMCMIPTSGY
jgi:hypothetical protein